MLLVLAIATCTARPHVALQVPVAGSLSSPRERVQCLLACPVGLAGSKLAKAKKPYVVLQVSLAGSLSSPRERVCNFFRLALLGLQGASWQKHNWVWLGLAEFARCMPRARFCPGVRANSFSETMLPGLNWWAYIIMTA